MVWVVTFVALMAVGRIMARRPARVALAWLLQIRDQVVPILGTKRRATSRRSSGGQIDALCRRREAAKWRARCFPGFRRTLWAAALAV